METQRLRHPNASIHDRTSMMSLVSSYETRRTSRLSRLNPLLKGNFRAAMSRSARGFRNSDTQDDEQTSRRGSISAVEAEVPRKVVESSPSEDPNAPNLPQLSLSKKDIELLRYLWDKMVLDEFKLAGEDDDAPIPGGFPGGSRRKQTTVVVARSLFCKRMYENLLGMAPDLEELFPLVAHQAGALAGVLTLAISQLENIGTIVPVLTGIAKKHSRIFGVEAPQFELVGEAFINTFHEGFGEKFTRELEVLWRTFYGFVAAAMLELGKDPVLNITVADDAGVPAATPTSTPTSTHTATFPNASRRGSTFTHNRKQSDVNSVFTNATATTGATDATSIFELRRKNSMLQNPRPAP